MNEKTIQLLEKNGWVVECESPFEIRNGESFASGFAAEMVVQALESEEGEPDPSIAVNIAMKELLHGFVKHFGPKNPPGAWEYDQEAVRLIDNTAQLLNISKPYGR